MAVQLAVARGAQVVARGLRYAFFGLHSSSEDLRTLVSEVDAGRLTPHVERTLPLVDAAEAHRLLEGRRIRGKVVLIPEESS
ncbi:zinc-binding dehydrogenase [Pseudonocardia acidicola]|uniref:Zinc-binding dehydrogenase n=1 Tax=Pseudonocardia acidicola TaxID=2724939 RepID=A0ABX1SCD8_9PSEU|nr:zinc-binding dehydrogenase [Pseudonocardia acidicola]NMH98202.1 zinc-binding dehydrogenase [Pseudonocardia acidicola]